MAEKIITNKQFVLQLRDFAKSWVMAVIFPIIQSVVELIKASGSLEGINWNNILTSTVLATLVYLGQRFAAPPAVVTTYNSNEQAVQVAEKVSTEANSGGI